MTAEALLSLLRSRDKSRGGESVSVAARTELRASVQTASPVLLMIDARLLLLESGKEGREEDV